MKGAGIALVIIGLLVAIFMLNDWMHEAGHIERLTLLMEPGNRAIARGYGDVSMVSGWSKCAAAIANLRDNQRIDVVSIIVSLIAVVGGIAMVCSAERQSKLPVTIETPESAAGNSVDADSQQ